MHVTTKGLTLSHPKYFKRHFLRLLGLKLFPEVTSANHTHQLANLKSRLPGKK